MVTRANRTPRREAARRVRSVDCGVGSPIGQRQADRSRDEREDGEQSGLLCGVHDPAGDEHDPRDDAPQQGCSAAPADDDVEHDEPEGHGDDDEEEEALHGG